MPASIEQQIAALRQVLANNPLNGTNWGSMSTTDPRYRDWQRQSQTSNQLNALLRQQSAAQAQAQTDAMTAQRDANRNQILANTEGRANELRSDPRAGAALDFLQGVVGGKNLPFGQEMQANYLTNAANTAGAQEAAQTQALREQMANNGGSMTDPSAMAALRELHSRRGGQIAQAQNQIGMQAGQANFGAQMQGANSLAAVNNSQNAQINQMLMGANAARLGSTFNFGGQPNLGGQQGGFSGGMVNMGTVGGPGATQNGIGRGTIVNDQGQFSQPRHQQQQPQVQGNNTGGIKAPVNAGAPQPMRTVGQAGPMAARGPATNIGGVYEPPWQVGNGDPVQPGYGVGQLTGQPATAQYMNATTNMQNILPLDEMRRRVEKNPLQQFGQSFGPILGK